MNNNNYVVYRLLNTLTGKSYVGITNDFKRRKINHFNLLKRGKHHSIKLQNSWNKYKMDAFEWFIVESNLSLESALITEVFWIEHFDSCARGYNMNAGGVGSGVMMGVVDVSQFGKKCVWNGIEYESQASAARALGISKSAMVGRIRKGYRSDEDMLQAFIERMFQDARSCVWNGVEYKSISEAAKATGVSHSVMSNRLQKGWVCDTDCVGSGGLTKLKPCTWNGVQYPSLKAAASDNGVAVSQMHRWLSKGYSCDSDIKSRKVES